MFLFLAASFCLLNHVVWTADPYDCSGEHSIDPPKNLSEAWFYPAGWTAATTAPTYAANQNCSWKFNVPNGMYAFLVITASTDPFALTMTDSRGNVEWMSTSADRDPYFLLDRFSVDLMVHTTGTLGMRVLWTKLGSLQPVSYRMVPNDVPLVLWSGAFDNGTVISSASRVSLVSLPPPPSFSELGTYMRNTVVFDGPTTNDKLLGNLWQIYDSGNQLVSSGNYLTIYSLMPDLMIHNYVLLQDYQNVEKFSSYKGIDCYSTTACSVAFDARNGSAAAVRMSASAHYLKTIQMPSTSVLDVYTGVPSSANLLRTYSYNQTKCSLPQQFRGLFTTYVLRNGLGAIQLSYDEIDVHWNTAFDGRNGFLASENFGTLTSLQNMLESFGSMGSEKYTITLKVKQPGLVGNATLAVTMKDGKRTTVDSKYTAGQLTSEQSIVSTGSSLTVSYDTNGFNTTGMFIEFLFEKKSTTRSCDVWLIAAASVSLLGRM